MRNSPPTHRTIHVLPSDIESEFHLVVDSHHVVVVRPGLGPVCVRLRLVGVGFDHFPLTIRSQGLASLALLVDDQVILLTIPTNAQVAVSLAGSCGRAHA